MKAVIEVGGKQYLVKQGEVFEVELLHSKEKTVKFSPMLVINGDDVSIGTPTLDNANVTAEILDEDVKATKVTAIRYKAKKRVHKVHGHRQHQTKIKITGIS